MKNKILPIVFAFVTLLAASNARAYYSPSTGRWLSRDPVGEPGFQALQANSPFPPVAPIGSTASLPPSRLFVRDAEDEDYNANAQNNQVNLYNFVNNQPLALWDSLGLLSAGGGQATTSWDEHGNHLTFIITCPKCSKFQFDHVDYSGAVPSLETIFGKKRVDNRAGTTPPAGGLGGVVPTTAWYAPNPFNVNCGGMPTAMEVYMRSRFSSPAWWYAGSKSAAGVSAYVSGTVIYYNCVPCN